MATAIRINVDCMLKSTYRRIDPSVEIVTLEWRSVGHFNVRIDMGGIDHFNAKNSVEGIVGVCLLVEQISYCRREEMTGMTFIYLVSAIAPSAVLWAAGNGSAQVVLEASLEWNLLNCH